MDRIIAAKTAGKQPGARSARRALRLPDRGEWLDRHDLRPSHRGGHEPGAGPAVVLDRLRWLGPGHRGPAPRGHPHPRSFGTFPRVLGEYVRNRRLLRLEDAVRKMTSLNAAKVGLLDRGILRPGLFADVVIFDPDTVIDHATYLEPFQYSTGIPLSSWSTVRSCSKAASTRGPTRVVPCGMVAEARPTRCLNRNACVNGQHGEPPSKSFEERCDCRSTITDSCGAGVRQSLSEAGEKKTGQRTDPKRGPLPSSYKIRSTGRLVADLGPSRHGAEGIWLEKGRAGGRARQPARPLAGSRSKHLKRLRQWGGCLKVGHRWFKIAIGLCLALSSLRYERVESKGSARLEFGPQKLAVPGLDIDRFLVVCLDLLKSLRRSVEILRFGESLLRCPSASRSRLV